MVVNLHLFGKEYLKPCVFAYPVLYEVHGLFLFNLNGGFSFLSVVKPCFRPPAQPGTVRIDGDNPRNVEALDVDIQSGQRVDDAAGYYCFVMKFFFTSPLAFERYTSCRKAR